MIAAILILVAVVAVIGAIYLESVEAKEPITKRAACLKWKTKLDPATKESYSGPPPNELLEPGEFCVGLYECVDGKWEGPKGACDSDHYCMHPDAIPNEGIHTEEGCTSGYHCVGDCEDDECKPNPDINGGCTKEAMEKVCEDKCENLLGGG